jgi:hypothetical protein
MDSILYSMNQVYLTKQIFNDEEYLFAITEDQGVYRVIEKKDKS